MSTTDVYEALVGLGGSIAGLKTVAADYPDPKGMLELLPLLLVSQSDGSFGMMDSETNEEESTWELWFFVSPLSKEVDQPRINSVALTALLMMQSAKTQIIGGLNLDTASSGDFRRIHVANRAIRRTRLLNDMDYGGMKFWGFKVFLSVTERVAV